VYVVATAERLASPQLLADDAGGLHLLFLSLAKKGRGERSELRYSHWQGGSWSAPVTIEGGRNGSVLTGVVAGLDRGGWLHVILLPNLRHISAHVAEANQPHSWTMARRLIAPPSRAAALAVDAGGGLHVVGAGLNGSIFYRASRDGGWSWPEKASLAAPSSDEAGDATRVAVDARGRVYATWAQHARELNWNVAGLFVAASPGAGQAWTVPWRAVEGGAFLDVATDRDDGVHLVWSEGSRCLAYHELFSTDGGATWVPGAAVQPAACMMTDVPGQVVVDGSDTPWMIETIAGGKDRSYRVFGRAWEEGSWSSPRLLGGGIPTGAKVTSLAAAVRLGDELHVIEVVRGRGLRYEVVALPAPRRAARALPPPWPSWRVRLSRVSARAWFLLAVLALLAASGARHRVLRSGVAGGAR